jgi:hypothetical protein
MHVQVRFALNTADTPPEPQIVDLLLKLPERWMTPLARFYTNAFVFGLAFYMAGWLVALLFIMPPSLQFGRLMMFIAGTGWLPFLYLFLIFNSYTDARLLRCLQLQQEAIERLEEDYGDVIGETVTGILNQLQAIDPAASPPDLTPFFRRH